MKIEMEALIYQFNIYTEGFAPPARPKSYRSGFESPRAELGFFPSPKAAGSPKPYRP